MQGSTEINLIWESIEEGDLIKVSFKGVKGYLEDYVSDVNYGEIFLEHLADFYFSLNEVSSIEKIEQPIKKGDSFIHDGSIHTIREGNFNKKVPEDAVWIIRNGQVSARLRD